LNAAPASDSRATRWVRFVIGLTGLALFAAFFMSGVTPPGVFGEVLRHNQTHDIDASPLFYSEVEHMQALEEGVRQMRRRAALRKEAAKSVQTAGEDHRQPTDTTTESQHIHIKP
jgi:hypothetical protein